MENELPDDSDGQALKILARKGVDMRCPIMFEFAIHVDDEKDSKLVVEKLRAANLADSIEVIYDEGELEQDEEMTEANRQFWPSWTVYVCRRMVPNYTGVIQFQNTLTNICLGAGKPDGWNVEIGKPV